MTGRLRIAAGTRLGPPAPGLRVLHRSDRLLVQGDDAVQVLRDGRDLLIGLGEVVGLRRGEAGLAAYGAGHGWLNDARRMADPAAWQDRLEGRWLVLRVKGDSADAATDRFGQMELYLQQHDGQLIAGTDLDLLPLATAPRGFDQAALAHALTVYGYRPPKRHTFYTGVRRLGIGQWLRIDGGRVDVKQRPAAEARTEAYGPRDLRRYARLLLSAVEARGSARGNVVYLSSGWDSTALLACLVRLFGRGKVRAVIGRMRYAERSGVINQFELDRAAAVAAYYKVTLDTVEFDYRRHGPMLLERHRTLFRSHQIASLTALNHALLADAVARSSRGGEVVFAGEISDGAHNLGFSQFVTVFHPVLAFREYSDKMASYCFGPAFLERVLANDALADPVYRFLRDRCPDAVFDEPAGNGAARRQQWLADFFLRNTRLPLWSLENCRLLTDAGRRGYAKQMEEAYLEQAAQSLTPETAYSWLLHLYNSFHWQSSTVATIALTAQARGLRSALPFWDSRLQGFLSSMPESWGRGLDLHPTKYPLKWMLEHAIDYPLHLQVGPHSYLYDVDPGFSHGAEILYGSAFAPYFRDLLQSRPYHAVLDPAWFNVPYLDSLVDAYARGEEMRGSPMNDLMAIALLSMTGWYVPASELAGAGPAS